MQENPLFERTEMHTQPCEPKQIRLVVRLEDGPATWTALQVNEAMAIHPEAGSVFFGNTFTITHIATGLSIAKGLPSNEAAKACAEELRQLLDWCEIDAKSVRKIPRAIKEAIHAVIKRHGGHGKGTQ